MKGSRNRFLFLRSTDAISSELIFFPKLVSPRVLAKQGLGKDFSRQQQKAPCKHCTENAVSYRLLVQKQEWEGRPLQRRSRARSPQAGRTSGVKRGPHPGCGDRAGQRALGRLWEPGPRKARSQGSTPCRAGPVPLHPVPSRPAPSRALWGPNPPRAPPGLGSAGLAPSLGARPMGSQGRLHVCIFIYIFAYCPGHKGGRARRRRCWALLGLPCPSLRFGAALLF